MVNYNGMRYIVYILKQNVEFYKNVVIYTCRYPLSYNTKKGTRCLTPLAIAFQTNRPFESITRLGQNKRKPHTDHLPATLVKRPAAV